MNVRITTTGRKLAVATLMCAVFVAGPAVAQVCTQDRLFISEPGTGTLYEFDHVAGTLLNTYSTTSGPVGLDVDADSTDIYFADINFGNIMQQPTAGGPPFSIASGFFPVDVVLNADESILYEIDGDNLRSVDLPSGPTTTINSSLTGNLNGIDLGARGLRAYVSRETAGTLDYVVVSGIGLGTTGPVASGFPAVIRDIQLSPTEYFAYTLDPIGGGGSLWQGDLRWQTSQSLIGGLGNVVQLALDQYGSTVFVVDPAGNVTEIDLVAGTASPVPLPAGVLVDARGIDLGRAQDPSIFITDVPDDLQAMPGFLLQVPVNITNVTGRGLTSIQVDVTYDTNSLSSPSGIAGAVTQGCGAVAVTNPAAGVARITASSCPPLQGEGPIATLTFLVGTGGSPTLGVQNSVLTPAIPHCTRNGALTFSNASVTGTVEYWSSAAPVEGVELTLTPPGSPAGATTSDAAGDYGISLASGGINTTLQPGKGGSSCGAITIVDALTAAQASVRLFTPTFEQELAGDVTGVCNSWIDSMGVPQQSCVTINDAFAMASIGAGLTTTLDYRPDEWGFIPDVVASPTITPTSPQPGMTIQGTIDYTPLTGNRTDQNWRAVLYGDINGNWSDCGPAPPPAAPESGAGSIGELRIGPSTGTGDFDLGQGVGPTTSTFGFSGTSGLPGDSTVVSLIVDDATGAEALDVVIYYNAGVGTPTDIQATALSAGQTLIYNLGIPGEIRAALYGPPLVGGGDLLDITFETDNTAAGSGMVLDLALAAIEESQTVTSILEDANFCVEGEGSPPGEVQQVVMTKNANAETVMSWAADSDALTYQVATAYPIVKSFFDIYFCSTSTQQTQAVLADTPAPGELQVFLVGAENCHGAGPVGGGSDNTSRPPIPACE